MTESSFSIQTLNYTYGKSNITSTGSRTKDIEPHLRYSRTKSNACPCRSGGLDRDLAEMYGVETRRLNEQVKRNSKRFPNDFMLTLTQKELDNLMSQFATSSLPGWGGIRKLPNAFTEQGVTMPARSIRRVIQYSQ
ncbi:ORF6N domain-containing protein [Niabella sp. CJ426]|uniref:ORF6N domain-containing protein n=1 Tax=Niabella sp. CJ426 TaxID=3393740 RepID=UPI003D02C7D7